jgi:vacuolar-type H+-ATPase subunit I/STV1
MTSDPLKLRHMVERAAELLAVNQLDLLAQLERQLRAVHRTMRQIEKLRSAKDRVGDELSNGQKIDALDHLTDELGVIDQELSTQHESCQIMLDTVETMRGRLREIRTLSPWPTSVPSSEGRNSN